MALISSTWNYYSPTYVTLGEHVSTSVTGPPSYLQASIKYGQGVDTYLWRALNAGVTSSEMTFMTVKFLGKPGVSGYSVVNTDIYKYQSIVINFELKYSCPQATTLILRCGLTTLATKKVNNEENYDKKNRGSWTVTITKEMKVTPQRLAFEGIKLNYKLNSTVGSFHVYGADFNILQRQHIVYYLTPRAYINVRNVSNKETQQIPLYAVDELKQCLTDNTSFDTTARTNVIYARVNSATYASIPVTPVNVTDWTGKTLLSELCTSHQGINARHYYQRY